MSPKIQPFKKLISYSIFLSISYIIIYAQILNKIIIFFISTEIPMHKAMEATSMATFKGE